jgi:hypothetical protein
MQQNQGRLLHIIIKILIIEFIYDVLREIQVILQAIPWGDECKWVLFLEVCHKENQILKILLVFLIFTRLLKKIRNLF